MPETKPAHFSFFCFCPGWALAHTHVRAEDIHMYVHIWRFAHTHINETFLPHHIKSGALF